jgi:hypothetical protein
MAIEKRKETKTYYSILKKLEENTKCPPQSKLIIDTITAAGGKMEREALLAQLKRPPEQGGLKTNQTAERILGFYRPKLMQAGILKEDKVTTEVEVEVPDKPKAEAKAAPAKDGSKTAPAAPAAPQTEGKKESAKGKEKEKAA